MGVVWIISGCETTTQAIDLKSAENTAEHACRLSDLQTNVDY